MIFINPEEMDQDIEEILRKYKPERIEEMREEIRRVEEFIRE